MSFSEDTLGLAVIEEAVMRDRGYNEEESLSHIVRSFLLRRGLASTLKAYDAEAAAICLLPDHASSSDVEHASISDGIQKQQGHEEEEVSVRKAAQLMCIQGRFEEAAACLPAGSVLRIKLLCLEALRAPSAQQAALFIAGRVAPLVPLCDDTPTAHELYVQYLSALVLDNWGSIPTGESPAQMAREVNEALLADTRPSAVNVLLSWARWQDEYLAASEVV